MKPVGVIGEGAWGTAVAQVLADNGYDVNLWCCDPTVAQEINTQHTNTRYMAGFVLPKTIHAHTDLKQVILDHDLIFISTPTAFFRSVVTRCVPHYHPKQCWVVLSKGIENETLQVPTQILREILSPQLCVGVVGGPSFAQEVMERQQTGVMVAAQDQHTAAQIAHAVHNEYFHTVISNDVMGVQLGGALKNVIALVIGIAHGAKLGDNPRALLFTRCWHELTTVAQALGAQPETLLDLPGIGDVFLTVTGKHSRNLAIGAAIGRGDRTEKLHDTTCVQPEGINTITSIKQLIEKKKIYAPVFHALYSVIFESAHPTTLVQAAVSSVTAVQKK